MRIPQTHFLGSTLRNVTRALDQSVFDWDHKPGVTLAATKIGAHVRNLVKSFEGDFYARRHRSQRIEDLLDYIDFEIDAHREFMRSVEYDRHLAEFTEDYIKTLSRASEVIVSYYNLPINLREGYLSNFISKYDAGM